MTLQLLCFIIATIIMFLAAFNVPRNSAVNLFYLAWAFGFLGVLAPQVHIG